MIAMTILFIALITIFLLDLLIYLLGIRFILPIFEARLTPKVKIRETIEKCETFATMTPDGIEIKGGIFRGAQQPAKGLVLYFPEFDGDFCGASYYCKGLIEAGFDVISFDFRNQGQSQNVAGYTPLHWLTTYEMTDAQAVLKFIRDHPGLSLLPLGFFGTSRGASVSLELARINPDIRAVAADGAFSFYSMVTHYTIKWADHYVPRWFARMIPKWRIICSIFLIKKISEFNKNCKYINIERKLSQLKGREVLLISGQRDSYVPTALTQKLYDRIASEQTKLWIAPNAKHNQSREINTNEFDQRVSDFFGAALK
jgi:uncharacterized protein